MKALYLISFALLIYACNPDSEINPTDNEQISWRTLPNYNLSYQDPSGDIEAETSNDLTNWSSGISTNVPSLYGTTSVLYDYDIPDTHRRWLVAYQNSTNQLLSVEFTDGGVSWTIPLSISSTSSAYLPTVEYFDGVVDEAHCGPAVGGIQYVKSSYKTAGTSWSSSASLYYSTLQGNVQIQSNFSPCLEYHQSAGVEYLVTVVISGGGATVPGVYWRSGSSIFNSTNSPSIAIGTTSPSERNSSLCAVGLNDGSDDLLYIFYTDPGESSSGEKEIKYVISPPINGGGNGAIAGGSYSSSTISGAYTNHKIDGFFDYTNNRLVIIFRNANTGYVDVAFSDDYGSTWDLTITNIVSASGAPSIAPLY